MNLLGAELNVREILGAFEVPGHKKWYTIGYGESRVTVYTQQVRGLNLAWALERAGMVSDRPIVVIGGGAAGLSVAAGLAHFGANVTVLEKEPFLLPLQRHCHKRHLHPHVFDWPDESSKNPFAGLPLLNWKAGMASDVAESIEASFQELAHEHEGRARGRLAAKVGAKNVTVDQMSKGRVGYSTSEGHHQQPYDTLIFALGFGVEAQFWAGRRGSYWADDCLDQHGVVEPGKYLVSGTGDGGLIDVLRILLSDTRQEDLARMVERHTPIEDLRPDINAIEADAKDVANVSSPEEVGQLLYDRYRELGAGPKFHDLDDELSRKLNKGVRVTLACRSASPFSLGSRPLHRLLLSRFLFRFGDETLALRTKLDLHDGILRRDRHEAVLEHGREERFDHVVLRHGTRSPASAFPELSRALKNFKPTRIDPKPLFAPADFGAGQTDPAPIAWSGGARQDDYLDALERRVGFVRRANGERISHETLATIRYEVRITADHEVAAASRRKPPSEADGSRDTDKERAREVEKAETEAQRRFEERYWQRQPGLALDPQSYEMEGTAFLNGRMGVGKSTFMGLVARRYLREHRGGTGAPVPIWVSGSVGLTSVDQGSVPAVLADAALRSAELGTYSSAARFLKSKLHRSGEAVVFLDAADAWPRDVLRVIVRWLQQQNVPALLGARRFSLDSRDWSLLGSVQRSDLLGVTPASSKRFLAAHLGGDKEHAAKLLDALRGRPDGEEWATNPFLLSLAALVARDEGSIEFDLSPLALFSRRIAIATRDLDSSAHDRVLTRLRGIAARDLCASPSQFYFARERLELDEREEVLSTKLFSGDRTLEFCHLSIGEYLAAQQLSALSDERRQLATEEKPSWRRQLEVLPMAHAASSEKLEHAFDEARQGPDHEHLLLALVLRALAYGGEDVAIFCKQHGVEVVAEVGRRLALPSGRFGSSERVLMRALHHARRALRDIDGVPAGLPEHGEPGAEAWGLRGSLVGPSGPRPIHSRWWPTVHHHARMLHDLAPKQVWEATRGGDGFEREAAVEALGDRGAILSVLLEPDERVRRGVVGHDCGTDDARFLGMLANDEALVRAWVIRGWHALLWTRDGMQAVLECAFSRDPSSQVQAEALHHIEPGTLPLCQLKDRVAELTKPRDTMGHDDSSLLVALLKFGRHADFDPIVKTLLDAEHGWYLGPDGLRSVCSDGPRAEFLESRLRSERPLWAEITAAKGVEHCTDALRALVKRFMRDPDRSSDLAAVLRSLPVNDQPTRDNRRECLEPEWMVAGADRESQRREELQRGAISSFADDPDAAVLLRHFLEETSSAELACAALDVIGRLPTVAGLVWKQAREGENNARIKALEILGENVDEAKGLRDHLDELSSDDRSVDWFRERILRGLGSRGDKDWLIPFLDDRAEPVRDAAIELLIDHEPARVALKKRVFAGAGHRARRRLWQYFADDPDVRNELVIRARPDQWAVRVAYFGLCSKDDTKLPMLREFFESAKKDDQFSKVVPPLIHILARDDEAVPQLRDLIGSDEHDVLVAVLDALQRDPGLRDQARSHLREPAWVARFVFHGGRAFRDYFTSDRTAQEILLKEVERGASTHQNLSLMLATLRGYPPAKVVLKGYVHHPDPNVAAAARRALVHDDPDVRGMLIEFLGQEDSWKRREAAVAVEDVDEAQEWLAVRMEDDTKELREASWRASRRLGRRPTNLRTLLNHEPEAGVRRAALRCVIDAADRGEVEREVLRERIAADENSGVRLLAASGLGRAEPAPPLRDKVDRAYAGLARDPLTAYLASPRALKRRDNHELFDVVWEWTWIKLTSTLREPTPLELAIRFVDPIGELLGEVLPSSDNLSGNTTHLRLAMDASSLPRDRNIWPAANVVLAWTVAHHLVSDEPRTVVLACADVASNDLTFPKLRAGELRLGPTFFGFRLRE